jgi:hypothetical protein
MMTVPDRLLLGLVDMRVAAPLRVKPLGKVPDSWRVTGGRHVLDMTRPVSPLTDDSTDEPQAMRSSPVKISMAAIAAGRP